MLVALWRIISLPHYLLERGGRVHNVDSVEHYRSANVLCQGNVAGYAHRDGHCLCLNNFVSVLQVAAELCNVTGNGGD